MSVTRMSALFLRTLREDPADAELPGHKLLVRAGYVRRAAPGIYSWLPLGLRVLTKMRFWQRWATTPLNERQVKLLNKLLDGFEGKLTSSKWAAIAKCSPDTALRDINDLLTRGVLRKSDAGGRSTSYELNDLPE